MLRERPNNSQQLRASGRPSRVTLTQRQQLGPLQWQHKQQCTDVRQQRGRRRLRGAVPAAACEVPSLHSPGSVSAARRQKCVQDWMFQSPLPSPGHARNFVSTLPVWSSSASLEVRAAPGRTPKRVLRRLRFPPLSQSARRGCGSRAPPGNSAAAEARCGGREQPIFRATAAPGATDRARRAERSRDADRRAGTEPGHHGGPGPAAVRELRLRLQHRRHRDRGTTSFVCRFSGSLWEPQHLQGASRNPGLLRETRQPLGRTRSPPSPKTRLHSPHLSRNRSPSLQALPSSPSRDGLLQEQGPRQVGISFYWRFARVFSQPPKLPFMNFWSCLHSVFGERMKDIFHVLRSMTPFFSVAYA